MRVFFTSDLHINHSQPFIWEKRGFNSIEEHDSFILDYWARTVTYEDTVILLGDFAMGKSKIDRAFDIIEKMPFENMVWVCGNHDHPIAKMQAHIDACTRSLVVIEMGNNIKLSDMVMSHFPPDMVGEYKQDRHRDYSKYAPKLDDHDFFVHGHTHSDQIVTKVGDKTLYSVGWDSHHGFIELTENGFVQPQKAT